MIGETYGNYRIVSQIGMGGMGAVYLAEHQHLERRAAIKVLLPEHSQDQEAIQRVLREARATSQIRHPGIVDVFDCDVRPDGRAFIVMELLDGLNLGDHLKAVGSLDAGTALFLTEQIANVLCAVHEKGIVHRDLKPDNIFLLPTPGAPEPFAVKVLDFGIAKLTTTSPNRTLTRTGHVIGSPPYMSPEQCRGVKRTDHRSDIYSLGCILYEMLCGRPPFVRQGPGEILVAHVAEVPPRPSTLMPSIPLSVERLLDRMLAKSPGARPANMFEVEREAAACRVLRSSDVALRVSQIRPTGQLSAVPFYPETADTPRRAGALFPRWGMSRVSVAAMVVGVTVAIGTGVATSRWLAPAPPSGASPAPARRLAAKPTPPALPSRPPAAAAPPVTPPPEQPQRESEVAAPSSAPAPAEPPSASDVVAVVSPPRVPAPKRARPRLEPRPRPVERSVELMSFGSAERLERPSRRMARDEAARKKAALMAPSGGGQR